MSSTRKIPKFEPGHGYTQEDWDEVSDGPELTEEDFASAKPFAEVFPELAAKMRARGAQKGPTKELISIRLDRDIVATLRGMGRGWQGRANDILRKALDLKQDT